ncbi:thiol:disulfide interchange protein [Pseudomonas daroniae]|uniref:Thiol:disulfide interchange protein n=2 Tax=Pseudomonadales TaxID=72274 RepID=A0A4Q9QSN6_9GAMM|nr:thiol:disulfide interchange protein [Pseudomonas daroniae]TBU85090.1 thiol:disulfide interchange protein [Pseudomonas sp. FRB 228]TBU93617.1 thiol:disulfide interchange protein [Pseudomonas daroniae]
MPMIRIIVLLLTLAACMQAAAQQMPDYDEVLIASSLMAESPNPAPGKHTTLAVLMEPQGDWHGYWKQPGDVGLAPTLDWQLPAGITVGEAAYPVPETLLLDGLMNHVYEQPYAVLVPLEVPADMAPGTLLKIGLQMQYLACRYDACVPERATLSIDLMVGDGRPDAALTTRFADWRRALPRPLGSLASLQIENGRFRLQVPVPADLDIGEAHLFSASPGALKNAAPQQFSRNGDLLIIETEAGDEAPATFRGVLALGDGSGLEIQSGSAAIPPQASAPNSRTALTTTLLAVAGAILGGLLLNIMPCVFPILSLKVLSITRANGRAEDARSEALAYTAGVMLVCLALGALILLLRAAGTQIGWAFQLQDPRVIALLLLLTTAIAFNLAGLFELGSVSVGDRLASSGGRRGAFWTGALAAFVATPCSGPFMATALGAALILPTLSALLIFAGLGLGITLPFLLLGFSARLRRCLPKPGPWMETVRRVLAVPMFLTVLALLWVLAQQVSANSLVLGIAAAMLLALGLWMTGLRQRRASKAPWLPAGLAAALALAGCLSLAEAPERQTSRGESSVATEAFDEQRLETLRNGPDPLFVYFTADWCVTCKLNEKAAIDREETRQALADAGAIVMIGDWTRGDPHITAFLEEHGRSGVPLYLWYRPGVAEPEILPQLLSPGLLVELAGS